MGHRGRHDPQRVRGTVKGRQFIMALVSERPWLQNLQMRTCQEQIFELPQRVPSCLDPVASIVYICSQGRRTPTTPGLAEQSWWTALPAQLFCTLARQIDAQKLV